MSDMFRSHDYVFGDIPISKATREPCLVCGHPTGDCVPDNHQKPSSIAFATSVIETMKDVQLILVDEDLYTDRRISPFTTLKVLVAKKGSYITLEKAIELGIN